MGSYTTLVFGRISLGADFQSTVQGWLDGVRPGADINSGHGDDIDAMRHGGTAALSGYRLGYQRTIELGRIVENKWPGPANETRQDLFNNQMGAAIGYGSKILGLNEDQMGDLAKKAYRDGVFQLSAMDKKKSSTLDMGNGFSITNTGRLTLSDGRVIDITTSVVTPSLTRGLAVLSVVDKYGQISKVTLTKDQVSSIREALVSQNDVFNSQCFAAGTTIQIADGSEKPIEAIRPGDMVASFDEAADVGRGALVGKRVVRTFVNENQIVIDFHGTKVTPGHAYLCGDGPHEGRFRQIMNIIRDDGAVVLADGSLMRAATGCAVGSPGDAFVEVQIARPARHRETGESVTLLKERGRVRAGTRVQKLDGSFVSFLDLIEANGWTLHEDGLVGQGPGHAPEPLLWAGPSIPKPEDYILARSQLTLADLYSDPQQAERPGVPLSHRPGQGEANAVVLQASPSREGAEPGPNAGYARTLVRRARNLLDAKRPKPKRVPKQAGETVH